MNVCIITEGTAGTGYGHLTRCLALYQGFMERKITPVFIANCDEGGMQILDGVQIKNFNWIHDSDRLVNIISGSDIAIIDSYLADLPLYEKVAITTNCVVFLDDTMRLDYPHGILINGSIGAENLPYKKSKYRKLLLGYDYIPLRKDFWEIPEIYRRSTPPQVLIVMGSKNCNSISKDVLSFLLPHYPLFSFELIVEQGFEYLLGEDTESYRIRAHSHVDAVMVKELMMRSEIIITAAGQSLYESLRFDAHVIPVLTAENQLNSLKGLKEAGFVKQTLIASNANFKRSLLDVMAGLTNPGIKSNHRKISGGGIRNIINNLAE